ncbi:uncharacterized protein [Primulina huaijiensis]|uniref:uncharacterized protein isoform X3 n=1 Tax=Primulina huaijiensis TaxID=1492673 RepID=UPI003CC7979E
MGACVSLPEKCVEGEVGGSRMKTSRKRRRDMRKRAPFQLSDRSSDGVEKIAPLAVDLPFNNPIFRGSVEEAWFDSVAALDSDWSDEDFHSVPDDMLYLNDIDDTSIVDIFSPRNTSHEGGDFSTRHESSAEHTEGLPTANSAGLSVNGSDKCLVPPTDSERRMKSNERLSETKPLYLDEKSDSVGENAGGDDSLLDNCGILPSNCLPCLVSSVTSEEKRRSLSSSPPDTRKKATLKLSFKWREGHPAANLLSSKPLLHRPIAGSQVPFCPLEKRVPDSWSNIEPGSFKIRGLNYLRDKKKELSSNCAAYYPFGLDVFLSQRKINHIARFVELPVINSSGKLPQILVVNVQIPLYPAAIFQGETDGKGISFVMYFKLSDSFGKEIPAHFQENIRKLIGNEVEKVKGFRGDTLIPFRERLKILGRVANVDDLPLSAAERKLMHAYNEKPVLSRPQHKFYTGEYYFEIDLDMHRFSYISRKGFETFTDRLKLCVLDFGLTIQGNKAEELPEHILCCVRLNTIDYLNYQQLGFPEETPE